ncbi:hypothetical protein J1614_007179 [Plenodomus biglobosus]|nr:hypothetical protein J1614_007179 [Plenodomus biglobosus]
METDHMADHECIVLESYGVGAESVVILHLQRGFQLLEWILATLKAGGAYVYLDPKLPDDRKKLVISIASGSKTILVTDDVLVRDAEWAKAFTGTVVPHVPASELSNPCSGPIAKKIEAGNLAYIIFTSGSTGHRSRVLQLASFNFDASILEWSSALAAGGTLCFADVPQALVGDYLADVIEQNAITFMQITPSALATIPLGRQVSSLRCVSIGGEAVPAKLTYTKGGMPIEQVSAGKPPQGTEIYICDPSFAHVLPYDTEGEVCIGGKSLGRGYVAHPLIHVGLRLSMRSRYCQRSDLTEAKFAIHPTLGKRLYRSGDRGKLLSDGYRIAPEEIEKAIMAADNTVHGASVQVSLDGLSLIAIVTPGTCQVEKVREGISKILPSHMNPSEVVAVPSLPLNVSGKIDHNKIRDNLSCYVRSSRKAVQKRPLKSTEVPPGSQHQAKQDSEVEKFISKVWQEEIGLSETPSTHVNFFDIGGHRYATDIRSI